MKYLVLIMALFVGLQVDALAQHVRMMKPQKAQRKHSRSRHHHSRRMQSSRNYHHTTRQARPVRARQEEMAAPYRGENARSNDGIRKNEQRNLNYNTGQPLPPSTGGR